MIKVFISYASEDWACAAQLHRVLVTAGYNVFMDRDPRNGIGVGEQWDTRLHERLRWADVVICVVSKAAVASTWCTAEISIALSRGSTLLPVRAEAGVEHPLLRSVQYADLTVDPAAAQEALMTALRRLDPDEGCGWEDDRSPFPGLRPLDVGEHLVFFGRRTEVQRLARLVRSPAERAMLLVVGPSGCGKSSLVRAGLLHVMADEPGWRTLPPILPGADPVAVLVRELATAARQLGLDWTVAQVRHQLKDTGLTGLADELLLTARAQRLLIVIDQFEELLTQTPPERRDHFAQLLAPALSGPVRVVATLRPEFLDQLLVDTALAMLPTQTETLRSLRRDALHTVIQEPAQLAGMKVDKDLVNRLVGDTDSGEALPLLAFTLAQLADGVGRGGQLSAARYEELGGVQGALSRQADKALVKASATTERRPEEVIAGLLRLVTVDEQGRPTRWRVPRDELPELVTRELDVFVDRRLLTTDTEHGNVVIGVAHEAFLSAWAPLAEAITQNVSALRARRAVEQAATEWHNKGRPPARLWERGQLAAALGDTGAYLQAGAVVTDRVDLSQKTRDFLRASIRHDRVRRGRAITVLSVLLVLAVVAAGITIARQRAAEQQRNVAVSRQLAGQALELRDTNPALAAQLGVAAYRLAPTTEARGGLLSTFATRYATRLTGHPKGVTGVAFSSDGRILVTSSYDKTARLWDISDPHRAHSLDTLVGHTDTVWSAAFSSDDRTLATTSSDATVQLWDISAPHQPHPLSTLTGHTNTVWSVAFSHDGRTLATTSQDKTVRLWDISDLHRPHPLSTLTGHTDNIWSVAFSSDDRTLATASSDKTARLWDISDPHQAAPMGTLTGHTDGVAAVAFSLDGHTLATGSADTTARLWDINDPRQPDLLGTLTGHTKNVSSVAFSPNGHTLATASHDRTARLWDISDPRQPGPLGTFTGHTGGIRSVAFSPDGHTLATGSYDNTARLWDLPGSVVAGHTSYAYSAVFSPDGHTLATASADNTARLWDVSDPRRPHPLSTLTSHTANVYSVAFSPNGHTLATASHDRTARLWDISDPHRPHPLSTLTSHTNNVYSVAFSPDGHILATGSADRTARLWDINDPRHPHILSTLTGYRDTVYSVAFSPNGHTLATASFDTTARLWDINDPRQPHPLSTLTSHTNGVNGVAFSPDGHTLATGSADRTVRLWDINDPGHPHPLSTFTGHAHAIWSVAFSPDGHTLATASADTTARLWDISDPRRPLLLGTLTSHTNDVSGVAFSPDGRTLATASRDATARLWETNVESVAARICSVTSAITKNEWDQYLPDLPYQPPCP